MRDISMKQDHYIKHKDDLIDVQGTINDSLAAGLFNRFDREAKEHHSKYSREYFASKRKINETTSKKRTFLNFKYFIKQYAGINYIDTATGKHSVAAFLLGFPEDKRDIRFIEMITLTIKKGTDNMEVDTLRIGVSNHAIKRFFERVHRPFHYGDVSALLVPLIRSMSEVNKIWRIKADVSFTIESYTKDGVLIYENYPDPLDSVLVGKTFLGLSELNATRQERYHTAMSKEVKSLVVMST